MTWLDDMESTAAKRWAKAVRNAEGTADLGIGPALKAYYTRYVPVALLVLVALWVAGDVIVSSAGIPDGREWLGLIILSLAFVMAFVGGLIYNARKIKPVFKEGYGSALLPLLDDERKLIRRQIAGQLPLNSNQLPVMRAAAVQQRKQGASQLILTPMYLCICGPWLVMYLNGTFSLGLWVMALAVVLFVVGYYLSIREFRRAGVFLARTAEPNEPLP